MQVFVVGLSHRTAPLELREQFALAEGEAAGVLTQLQQLPGIGGVLTTSTCNRFEVYGSSEAPEDCISEVRHWLENRTKARKRTVRKAIYDYLGPQAVRHIFRVSASLDSMVVGESQILGQVKHAFAEAARVGTLDSALNRCMTEALRVAKQVRAGTGVARHAVSVPSVSVGLTRKVFGDLNGRSALLIGAGEMCELAARKLVSQGVSRFFVANRSQERAQTLAQQFDGSHHPLDHIPRLLEEVEIVLSSTGSKDYVLKHAQVKTIQKARRYRPLFIIDIAVPRDVDPRIGNLDNVYLFDIDDLQQVVSDNLGERQREAREAERLVAQRADSYLRSQLALTVTPTIVSLRHKLTTLKDQELARCLAEIGELSPRDQQHIEKLANTLVNRILHEPSVALKRLAQEGQAEEAAAMVDTLFDLNSDELG